MGLCKSKLPHKGRALRSRRRGIITDLISNTMLSCQESWAFLTDGFPWKLKQAKELERIVGRAPDLIMFDCSMDAMVCRVWHRGQKEHRVRDCESALRQGLETYDTLCEPVLTSYQQNNLLRNADLGRSSSRRHSAQCCSVTERLQ
ncbi:adenylate kinase isoenzyme 5 isoform X7 [Felis catus]|uniref:adenylate kinase isoenzyme 5 isoform X7 n=1 Tax=Felis catus TaxID=9685 RepID=UPI0003F1B977|nr:adenylate kinase isoenzyme 5 isoform X7 [Felis catus]